MNEAAKAAGAAARYGVGAATGVTAPGMVGALAGLATYGIYRVVKG